MARFHFTAVIAVFAGRDVVVPFRRPVKWIYPVPVRHTNREIAY